jgi:2-hydroxy-3-keto-5-methylthiopentenyl-1-phosphate phosphatase
MRQQAELIRATPAQLRGFADGVEIDPGFIEVASICARRGVECLIASDGYDIVIERALARHKVQCKTFSNRLVHAGGALWRLSSPHARAECRSQAGTCKCALAGGPVILLGDGKSDFCVAERASFVFAKGRLRAYCSAHRIPYQGIDSLQEAVQPLSDMLALAALGVATTID